MSLIKNVFIILAVVVLAVSGVIIAENLFGTSLFSQQVGYSSQAASSTVYIQNGVSGVVTLTDPFLGRTVNINVNYDPIDSGSGVIVSNNGYIITAFHVIGDPNSEINGDQLKLMSSNDVEYYLEEAAVTSYMSQDNPQLGAELLNNNTTTVNSNVQANSNNNINNILELLNQRNLINASSYKQGIRVKLQSSSSFINASIIDVGDASTDEDVALLKVNANNLPSLSINSQQPQANENLRIYGYPGNSTESQFYQTDSSVTPTTSTGNLQSEVTNSLNILYYETSAKVSEGFSGGPVLDNQNNILGIVIYSVATQNRFRQVTNSQSSVFLSSKYLIQLCNKNHIPITLN